MQKSHVWHVPDPTCGDAVDRLRVGDHEAVADPAAVEGISAAAAAGNDPEAVGAPHHHAPEGPLLLVVAVPGRNTCSVNY